VRPNLEGKESGQIRVVRREENEEPAHWNDSRRNLEWTEVVNGESGLLDNARGEEGSTTHSAGRREEPNTQYNSQVA